VIIVAIFVVVARSSRRDVPFDYVRDVGYRARLRAPLVQEAARSNRAGRMA
jgi:hypothetical protein